MPFSEITLWDILEAIVYFAQSDKNFLKGSAQNGKNWTVFDIQGLKVKNRTSKLNTSFLSSTFQALTVINIYLCIWKNRKFHFHGIPPLSEQNGSDP